MKKRLRIKKEKPLICSSADYERTHRAYFYFLREWHNKHHEEVEALSNRLLSDANNTSISFEEQVALGKRPFVRCFGKLEPITLDMASQLDNTIKIFWR